MLTFPEVIKGKVYYLRIGSTDKNTSDNVLSAFSIKQQGKSTYYSVIQKAKAYSSRIQLQNTG